MNKVCILKMGRKLQSVANEFSCEVLREKYKRIERLLPCYASLAKCEC